MLGPQRRNVSSYAKFRYRVARNLMLTNYVVELFERFQVKHGYYHLTESAEKVWGALGRPVR